MNADREYLAAGLALGTLADAEMLQALDLEATDPSFAEEVQSFSETLGLLAESDDAIAPSPETEAAILAIPRLHQQAPDSAPEDVSATVPAPASAPDAPQEQRERPAAASRSRRPATMLFALAASTLLLLSAVLAGALINSSRTPPRSRNR